MSDNLLITWFKIHEELFCDEKGKPVISLSSLQQKYGPGLKAAGAVMRWKRGPKKTMTIAGWRNVIQNYFIKLGQEEDAERVKAKLAKAANNSK